jgi:adenylate kinase family enzyme
MGRYLSTRKPGGKTQVGSYILSHMSAYRIHITGASGSGTSTLGQSLALRLGFEWLDADAYFWEPTNPPFRVRRQKGERLCRIFDDLERFENAILSGCICGWDERLENAFDLEIFLAIPREIRLARLREREIRTLGKIDPEFMDWTERYEEGGFDVRSRLLHERWLCERKCDVLRIEGDRTNDDRIATAIEFLRQQGSMLPDTGGE